MNDDNLLASDDVLREVHRALLATGNTLQATQVRAAAMEARSLRTVIRRAASILHGGEGVTDQGEAWDKALRLLDATVAGETRRATMKGYKTIGTSAEVWAVLKARHGAALRVYGSYSAPEGDHMGDPTQAVMMTEYGFEDGKWPLMGARTTWELTEKPGERKNEHTAYWLCYRTETQHEEDA